MPNRHCGGRGLFVAETVRLPLLFASSAPVGRYGNAAPVEIRQERGFPQGAWKAPLSTFPQRIPSLSFSIPVSTRSREPGTTIGRGVPGRRHPAWPQGRHQVPDRGARERRDRARAAPSRGAVGGGARPSLHLQHLRDRRDRRADRHRDGARVWRDAAGDAAPVTAVGDPLARDRRRNRRGARGGAQAACDSSRPEAVEHHGHRAGPREGDGFWARQGGAHRLASARAGGDDRTVDRLGDAGRHPRLHGAGAAARRRGGRPVGHLRVRHPALRVAGRGAPVHAVEPERDDVGDHPRGAGADQAVRRRPAEVCQAHARPRARQGAASAVPEFRGPARRSAPARPGDVRPDARAAIGRDRRAVRADADALRRPGDRAGRASPAARAGDGSRRWPVAGPWS